MADPFTLAVSQDYVDRYGPVDSVLAGMLDSYLARASRIVRDELAASGVDIRSMIAAGAVQADTAADVVCDMVSYMVRSSGSGEVPFGASQATTSAGPYSQSATFATPTGSLSFTRVHRRRLGLTVSRAFEVDLLQAVGP